MEVRSEPYLGPSKVLTLINPVFQGRAEGGNIYSAKVLWRCISNSKVNSLLYGIRRCGMKHQRRGRGS
ncbi:hypothetical protein SAY87_023775 [Trapa incisa]|uniref:Uncharacterized protein n=1 Tax=Trapa incisa TaxID=236973 RepID=A0AAN7L1S6_9MYRT|nr:hypothetical protein SAY87_023775 [Trapa incisa]